MAWRDSVSLAVALVCAVVLLAATAVDRADARRVPTRPVSEDAAADLHTHSSHSDGSDSQLQVVRNAAAAGLALVAITDHDQLTVDADAVAEAKALGVELLIGTEISTEWTFAYPENLGKTMAKAHVLGYYVAELNPTSVQAARFVAGREALARALAGVRRGREQRNEIISQTLKRKWGFDVSVQEILHAAADDNKTPGRPHFAKVMVKKGYATNIGDAFARFLSDERLALERWSVDIIDAVNLIHDAGGVAVLAHPSTLGLDPAYLQMELMALLDRAPLLGLECWSSRHTPQQAAAYLQLATATGLVPTGGSDFHGTFKPGVKLGVFARVEPPPQLHGKLEPTTAGTTTATPPAPRPDDAAWRRVAPSSVQSLAHFASRLAAGQNGVVFRAALWSVFASGAQYVAIFAVLYALFVASVAPAQKSETGGAAAWLRSVLARISGDDALAGVPKGTAANGANGAASGKADADDKGNGNGHGHANGHGNGHCNGHGDGHVECVSVTTVPTAAMGTDTGATAATTTAKPKSAAPAGDKDLRVFAVAAGVLLFLLMVFGYMQERIMTMPYDGERFTQSELLVFFNRISALAFATAVLQWNLLGRPPQYPHAPAVRYGAASMSNIGSTWAQYEALRFISFPLQVLSKTGKPLFTMVGGALMRGVKYSAAEYLSCVLLTAGLVFFSVNEAQRASSALDGDVRFVVLGAALILVYIVCDSYTSNFQKVIYDVDRVTEFQLMQGMNGMAMVIALALALLHGQFWSGLSFMTAHPACLVHVTVMSLVSAFSQTAIMFINRRFGPMYLTLTTTTRQFASSVLSIVWFGHTISPTGWFGLVLVFAGAFILLRNSKR